MTREIFERIFPIIALIVTQLHLLRNLTSLYLVLFFFVAAGSFFFAYSRWSRVSSRERLVIVLVILLFLVPSLATIFGLLDDKYDSFEEVLLGLSRLFFVFPIYLLILCSPNTGQSISRLVLFSAVICLIAAMSIPFQYVFGPISWFAESSERSGLERYASLFGSLTSFGLVCGYGLLSAFLSARSKIVFGLIVSGIALGAILSLQKAALINFAICMVVAVMFLSGRRLSGVLQLIVLIVSLPALSLVIFPEETRQVLGTFRLFSDSEASSPVDDFSLEESILDRVIFFPLDALSFHGHWSALYGVGPIAGSGAFGFPDVPMSHNGVVDLFLVGGVFYFATTAILFVYLFRLALKTLKLNSANSYVRYGLIVLLIFAINLPFSGLLFFAPSSALFFAIAIKCIVGGSIQSA